MKQLVELTGDTQVAGWVPTEAWADLILEASVCYGQLSGVITAVDYDLAAGNGNSVLVRSFPARTAQGGTWHSGCTCLAAVSSTLAHTHITINQWGDYDQMCNWSLWKAKGPVKEGILNEMAKGLASARDTRIWTAMTTLFAPTYHVKTAVACTSTTTDGTCCDYKYNLFNSIVSIKAQMQDACLNPDYVIMNPTVAKWFYIGDKNAAYHGIHIQFGANDKLISIAGLKVIETGLATTCNATSGSTMAVIIDSSRAVGEAWGKRPTFSEDYVPECDYYKEVVWMWWGADTIQTTAIGHILNV